MTAPRPLGYWVKTVDRLLDDQFETAAEATGIDRREWRILNRLEVGAVSEDALRDAVAPFFVDGENVADALDGLMSAKLVEERAGEYRLTERGEERVSEVQRNALKEIRGSVTHEFSADDYEGLLQSLERLARNLGWQAP